MNKMPTETMTGPEAEDAETPKVKRRRRKISPKGVLRPLLLLLVPALLYDLIRQRRIHRAWVWGLGLLLPWVVATEFVWGSDWWREVGPKLVGAA